MQINISQNRRVLSFVIAGAIMTLTYLAAKVQYPTNLPSLTQTAPSVSKPAPAQEQPGVQNNPPAPPQTPEPAPSKPTPKPSQTPTESTPPVKTLLYNFNVPGVLEESRNMKESPSQYWWLDSGAILSISDGTGRTNQGYLDTASRWRDIYNSSNPVDTDNGLQPQNIFRLVTKSKWQNFREESYFKINSDNLIQSPNRNESNGLLFFLRYQDGNNLYYAGLRVDGSVVIKKKIHGTYFTLAQKQVVSGTYNRTTNPNLLPKGSWIGLRAEISDSGSGSTVTIKFSTDLSGNGSWSAPLVATDSPGGSDGDPIYQTGYAGIRTDFMDVEFKNFQLEEM